MRVFKVSLFLVLLMLPLVTSCRSREEGGGGKKLQVLTTLFPLYDFTRVVGGDRVEVRLLIPPGVEPHSFEPRPEDVVRLNKADLFIYTNPYMEPWAAGMLNGVESRGLLVVDASAGVSFMPVAAEEGQDGHGEAAGERHHEGVMDPHVWLSIPNAEKMVENIRTGLTRKDQAGSEYYRRNAEAYRAKLEALDQKFKDGLSDCRQHLFLDGGHYAFGYLAQHYGLGYVAAYAVSANAEPTPHKLMALVDQIRKNSLHYVFYEELLSPRVADTIARETGATLLKLHVIDNVSREEMAAGAGYLSLMEHNLKNLRIGLQCR